ncbi:hypothetical protein MHBO_000860 [Bonamia ostreae]|uniref:Phytanoyl-CoA dioxygenase n=1 Tax=Bonamia ostreae TaxID=126728 RepID=A0ABV2AH30_9EUKA
MPLNKIEKSKIKTNSKLILKKNKNLFNKTKIQIGNYLLAPGKNLFPLKNSNDFLKNEDYKNIKEKIDRDGYFYLKNFFDKKTIETARKKIFVFLANSNLAKKLNFGKNIAVLNDENKEGFTVQMISGKETKEKPNFDTEKWKDLCQSKELKKIYDGLSLNGLLKSVFGNIKMLSDQSWLRLIGRNGATQEHADYYYFKNESVFNIFAKEIKKERIGNFGFGKENCFVCRKSTKETEFRKCALCAKLSHLDCLDGERKNSLSKKHFANEGEFHCKECASSFFGAYTCWICLGEKYKPSNSILGISPKSQNLANFDLPQFGKQVPTGFDKNSVWEIAPEMEGGDIIVFNIKTVHGASINTSRNLRLSCDVRFLVKEL